MSVIIQLYIVVIDFNSINPHLSLRMQYQGVDPEHFPGAEVQPMLHYWKDPIPKGCDLQSYFLYNSNIGSESLGGGGLLSIRDTSAI